MTREDIIETGWEKHNTFSDILVKDKYWCLYGVRLGLRYYPDKLKIMDSTNDFILFDDHCTTMVEFNKICKKLKI